MAVQITGLIAQYLQEQVEALMDNNSAVAQRGGNLSIPLTVLREKGFADILAPYGLTEIDLLKQGVLLDSDTSIDFKAKYSNRGKSDDKAAKSIKDDTLLNVHELGVRAEERAVRTYNRFRQ